MFGINEMMGGGLAIALVLIIYLLPTFVAVKRKHPATVGVFIVNLLFGATVIGWIAAFIWAFGGKPAPQPWEPTKERFEPLFGGIDVEQSNAGTTKICPDCAEDVKAAARICRFCGHDFSTDPAEPEPGS